MLWKRYLFTCFGLLTVWLSLPADSALSKKYGKCELESSQSVYEVTPGMGWDNLRNVEMGRVLQLRYDDCLTSQDGKYLLPNSMSLTPIKQSNVDLDSETFTHFNNYTSLTAASINVDGSAQIQDVGISGSFSFEHQSMKSKLVDTKSIITRVSLRHEMYVASAQPDSPLSPEFRNRLMDLASHLLADPSNSEARDADYEADLLVRDFGTHVITSTTSGTILSKVDHLDASFVENMQSNMNSLRHSASASFLNFFKMSVTSTLKISQAEVERYQNNTSHSVVMTMGGPPFGENFSLDAWGDDIANNLVAIDRRGDPLFFVVNPRVLEELPESVVYKVATRVREAVLRYYKANTLRGCMDMHSPNFNENANIDSSDCTTATQNFTFGGVFQVCSGEKELCQDLEQRNPATGDFSCSEEYQAVELNYAPAQRCREHCERKWYVVYTKVTCKTVCASVHTSWCAPKVNTPSVKGFLIGGMFTKTLTNPVTNDRTCPPQYFGVNFGLQGTLCLSADTELGAEYQLSFGGFFSCSVGNPLASEGSGETADRKMLKSASASDENKKVSTQPGLVNQQFWQERGSRNWPSRCAPGFTQHLAFMDTSCEIMYCVKANQLSRLARRHIRRPPFIQMDYTSPNRSLRVNELVGPNNELWVRDKGGVWKRDYEVQQQTAPGAKETTSSGNHVTVVLLSIFGALMFIALLLGGVYYGPTVYRRIKTRRNYSELLDTSNATSTSAYQEINTEVA